MSGRRSFMANVDPSTINFAEVKRRLENKIDSINSYKPKKGSNKRRPARPNTSVNRGPEQRNSQSYADADNFDGGGVASLAPSSQVYETDTTVDPYNPSVMQNADMDNLDYVADDEQEGFSDSDNYLPNEQDAEENASFTNPMSTQSQDAMQNGMMDSREGYSPQSQKQNPQQPQEQQFSNQQQSPQVSPINPNASAGNSVPMQNGMQESGIEDNYMDNVGANMSSPNVSQETSQVRNSGNAGFQTQPQAQAQQAQRRNPLFRRQQSQGRQLPSQQQSPQVSPINPNTRVGNSMPMQNTMQESGIEDNYTDNVDANISSPNVSQETSQARNSGNAGFQAQPQSPQVQAQQSQRRNPLFSRQQPPQASSVNPNARVGSSIPVQSGMQASGMENNYTDNTGRNIPSPQNFQGIPQAKNIGNRSFLTQPQITPQLQRQGQPQQQVPQSSSVNPNVRFGRSRVENPAPMQNVMQERVMENDYMGNVGGNVPLPQSIQGMPPVRDASNVSFQSQAPQLQRQGQPINRQQSQEQQFSRQQQVSQAQPQSFARPASYNVTSPLVQDIPVNEADNVGYHVAQYNMQNRVVPAMPVATAGMQAGYPSEQSVVYQQSSVMSPSYEESIDRGYDRQIKGASISASEKIQAPDSNRSSNAELYSLLIKDVIASQLQKTGSDNSESIVLLSNLNDKINKLDSLLLDKQNTNNRVNTELYTSLKESMNVLSQQYSQVQANNTESTRLLHSLNERINTLDNSLLAKKDSSSSDSINLELQSLVKEVVKSQQQITSQSNSPEVQILLNNLNNKISTLETLVAKNDGAATAELQSLVKEVVKSQQQVAPQSSNPEVQILLNSLNNKISTLETLVAKNDDSATVELQSLVKEVIKSQQQIVAQNSNPESVYLLQDLTEKINMLDKMLLSDKSQDNSANRELYGLLKEIVNNQPHKSDSLDNNSVLNTILSKLQGIEHKAMHNDKAPAGTESHLASQVFDKLKDYLDTTLSKHHAHEHDNNHPILASLLNNIVNKNSESKKSGYEDIVKDLIHYRLVNNLLKEDNSGSNQVAHVSNNDLVTQEILGHIKKLSTQLEDNKHHSLHNHSMYHGEQANKILKSIESLTEMQHAHIKAVERVEGHLTQGSTKNSSDNYTIKMLEEIKNHQNIIEKTIKNVSSMEKDEELSLVSDIKNLLMEINYRNEILNTEFSFKNEKVDVVHSDLLHVVDSITRIEHLMEKINANDDVDSLYKIDISSNFSKLKEENAQIISAIKASHNLQSGINQSVEEIHNNLEGMLVSNKSLQNSTESLGRSQVKLENKLDLIVDSDIMIGFEEVSARLLDLEKKQDHITKLIHGFNQTVINSLRDEPSVSKELVTNFIDYSNLQKQGAAEVKEDIRSFSNKIKGIDQAKLGSYESLFNTLREKLEEVRDIQNKFFLSYQESSEGMLNQMRKADNGNVNIDFDLLAKMQDEIKKMASSLLRDMVILQDKNDSHAKVKKVNLSESMSHLNKEINKKIK